MPAIAISRPTSKIDRPLVPMTVTLPRSGKMRLASPPPAPASAASAPRGTSNVSNGAASNGAARGTEQANNLTSCQRREDGTVMNQGKAFPPHEQTARSPLCALFWSAHVPHRYVRSHASFPLAEYSRKELNSAFGPRFSHLREASGHV